jgi:hypothetical protein
MKVYMKLLVACVLLAAVQQTTSNAIPHRLLKREIAFGQCPTTPLFDVTVDLDSISNGQTATFTYSGPITRDITEKDIIAVAYKTVEDGDFTCPEAVCKEGNECPIKAGTSFTKTIKCTAPASAQITQIEVSIVNPEVDAFVCARANV